MCRSPLAERLGRLHYPEHHWESAGVRPVGFMHPLSQQILKELGGNHRDFMARQVRELDLEDYSHIVLIGESARLHTQDSPAAVARIFWDVPDPYGAQGSQDEQLAIYRECGLELAARLHALVRGSTDLC